jgi:nucleoid DNA-binding protein
MLSMANRISNRLLIKRVAKSSGYHLYEVEDILNHLIVVIQHSVRDETAVHIAGLGTFSFNVEKRKSMGHDATKPELVDTKVVRFKSSPQFKSVVKGTNANNQS